jgi:hypothetical protein
MLLIPRTKKRVNLMMVMLMVSCIRVIFTPKKMRQQTDWRAMDRDSRRMREETPGQIWEYRHIIGGLALLMVGKSRDQG